MFRGFEYQYYSLIPLPFLFSHRFHRRMNCSDLIYDILIKKIINYYNFNSFRFIFSFSSYKLVVTIYCPFFWSIVQLPSFLSIHVEKKNTIYCYIITTAVVIGLQTAVLTFQKVYSILPSRYNKDQRIIRTYYFYLTLRAHEHNFS